MASNIPIKEDCEEQNILEPPASFNANREFYSSFPANKSNSCGTKTKMTETHESFLNISDAIRVSRMRNNLNYGAEINKTDTQAQERGANNRTDNVRIGDGDSLLDVLDSNPSNCSNLIPTQSKAGSSCDNRALKKSPKQVSSSSSSIELDQDSSSSDSESLGSLCCGVEETNETPPNKKTGAIKKLRKNVTDHGEGPGPLKEVSSQAPNNAAINKKHFIHVGTILAIGEVLVTIQPKRDAPSYDIGALMFIDENGTFLGCISQVADACDNQPLYYIRKGEIKVRNLQRGQKVYSFSQSDSSKYVYLPDLLDLKNQKSSWLNNRLSRLSSRYSDETLDDSNDDCFTTVKPKHPKKRSSSLEKHKRFEETMNVENNVNTQIHKMRDAFLLARKQRLSRSFSRIITQASSIDDLDFISTTTTAPSEILQYPPGIPPSNIGTVTSSTVHNAAAQPMVTYTGAPQMFQGSLNRVMVPPWVETGMLIRPVPPVPQFVQGPRLMQNSTGFRQSGGVLFDPLLPQNFVPVMNNGFPVAPNVGGFPYMPLQVPAVPAVNFVGSTNMGTAPVRVISPQIDQMRLRGMYVPNEYLRHFPLLVPVINVPLPQSPMQVVRPHLSQPVSVPRTTPGIHIPPSMVPHCIPNTLPQSQVPLQRRNVAAVPPTRPVRILQPPHRDAQGQTGQARRRGESRGEIQGIVMGRSGTEQL